MLSSQAKRGVGETSKGLRVVSAVAVKVVLITLFGCSSKSDEPGQDAGSPAPASNAATAVPSTPPAAASKSVGLNKHYQVAESFGVGRDIFIRALTVDRMNKSLWVGTSAGVLQVDLESRDLKQRYSRDAGLANEYVFAIHAQADGSVWFGTNGGGISRFQQNTWRTFFPMHGLADYWAYSFGEQRDGTLWIGTWAGVSKQVRGEDGFTNYVKELVNEWVYGIVVDREDRVWFATEGGVSRFDGKAWREWTHADGLGGPNTAKLAPSDNTGLGTRARHELSVTRDGLDTYNPGYVFCIMEAIDGNIWAGTWGAGVSRFDGQQWHNLTVQDGLAGNVVYSMDQDREGAFWFGTQNGLSRYDGKNWERYDRTDGLYDQNVYAIAVSDDGSVWVGTRSGVVRLSKKSQ